MQTFARRLGHLARQRVRGGTIASARCFGLGSALALTLSAAPLAAQQRADTLFRPRVSAPAFASASGPRLCVDEAHYNFHTLDGRFAPFGALMARDGFRVSPSRARIAADALRACDIFVISNAQPSDRPWNQYPRPTPSAFAADEIAALVAWVRGGGALLLIADHMPLAGAAAALARAFEAEFTDGFAYEGWTEGTPRTARERGADQPTLFTRGTGTLRAHAVSDGRTATERVTQVRSFTGQAFRWDAAGVEPLLVLPDNYVSLEPEMAWQFTDDTPVRPVGGWLQGAVRAVGRGKVALFGEAAMFSAQRAGPGEGTPMGMNAPMAEQNAQFALNLLRWLGGAQGPAR